MVLQRCASHSIHRQYGAIPALIGQLHNEDTKVVVPVLGALRNLSFGRINDENKLMMVREQGLEELMRALTTSRVTEVSRSSSQVAGGSLPDRLRQSLGFALCCVVMQTLNPYLLSCPGSAAGRTLA